MSNTITIRQPGTGGHRSTSAGEISRDFWHVSKRFRGNEDSKEFEVVFFGPWKHVSTPNLHLKHAQFLLETSLEVKEVDHIYNSQLHQTKETNQPHQGTNTRISDPRTKILCGNLKAPPSGSLLWGNGWCFALGFYLAKASRSKRLGVNFATIWPVKLKVAFSPQTKRSVGFPLPLLEVDDFWWIFFSKKTIFHQLNRPNSIETWDTILYHPDVVHSVSFGESFQYHLKLHC